jgi:hypothetical protein
LVKAGLCHFRFFYHLVNSGTIIPLCIKQAGGRFHNSGSGIPGFHSGGKDKTFFKIQTSLSIFVIDILSGIELPAGCHVKSNNET